MKAITTCHTTRETCQEGKRVTDTVYSDDRSLDTSDGRTSCQFFSLSSRGIVAQLADVTKCQCDAKTYGTTRPLMQLFV
ncbi:hypothetical protein CEXT_629561 [Caerostris extrusa]|uniref:Uncharacterized protein n=1 Tax=Caerostris extrusa TaxID=172846 RepID=A0AAV4MCU0_CAEEX|nr:hypothetical protein CEXT_629561 [Caerostris extrusa]